MAKQFYFQFNLDTRRTEFKNYHTHVTCPIFSGNYVPVEAMEKDILLFPKCKRCQEKDKQSTQS